MSKTLTVLAGVALVLILLAGNTHRFLPAASDPCQQDMSHLGHVHELPMFHCIGHSEYEVDPQQSGLRQVARWDHVHPWMTLEWHLEQGFAEVHARQLLEEAR